MKQIVVGYDGSDHARRALERAAELAAPETVVTVVAAVHVVSPLAGQGPGAALVDQKDAAERDRALEEAKAFLEERGVPVATAERIGDPAAAIVDTASHIGADLIIVGTRGRNLAQRLSLGSVSTRVVHDAHCDVLVVR